MDPSSRSTSRRLVFSFLKRLASTLIPIGYSLGDFIVDAKAAFVDAAVDHITNRGDRPSDARIAILTGLSRAEVRKIRSMTGGAPSALNTQRAERVMHGWFTDARFVDMKGAPSALPIKGEISFESLVKEYSGDMPYRAVLNELLAGGMASKTGARYVQALRRHYLTPAHDARSDLQLLSLDAEVLLQKKLEENSGSVRRLEVEFSSTLPSSTVRNIDLRIERFLDALSDYLHSSSIETKTNLDNNEEPSSTFRILIAHRELGNRRSNVAKEDYEN